MPNEFGFVKQGISPEPHFPEISAFALISMKTEILW